MTKATSERVTAATSAPAALWPLCGLVKNVGFNGRAARSPVDRKREEME